MNSTYEAAVTNFDLDFLHPDSNTQTEKQIKLLSKIKRRIIKAHALYNNFHVLKQELTAKNKCIEETTKKLNSTNLEYKQTSLEYQKALCSITKLESEIQKLRITVKKLGDEYVNIDNELRASQSHIVQLQQLLKLKDENIEIYKKKEKDLVDKLNQDRLIAKNKGKDKEVLIWKKKYETLQKQMAEIQSDKKRKMSKKLSTTEKNYKDTNTSDFRCMEDPSFGDDDISECTPLSTRRSMSQTSLDTQTRRESFYDYSNDIVSVDTGCGSSLCSSDNEKFINSPDFVFSPINVGGIENQSRKKVVSIATSPILLVNTVEVANSPVPLVRMIDTATSPIPSLNIIKVMTNPVRSVKTFEIGTSPIPINTADTGTSPIPLKTVDTGTSPIPLNTVDTGTSPIPLNTSDTGTTPIPLNTVDTGTSPIPLNTVGTGTSPIQSLKLVENIISPITSLGLIEAMTNPTLSENKASVTASQIPLTPIIMDHGSPITLQADDDESDNDLMVFSPLIEDNETLDKPPYMNIMECTNSSDNMDIEDFEHEQEEVSIRNETSVKDIPSTTTQPTQIASEDLPNTNEQVIEIVSVSAEDISSKNAHKNQVTLKELESTSAPATQLTSARVEDVTSKIAQMPQITSDELPSTSAQSIKITSAKVDVIPSLNAPASQTASELPATCEQVILTTTTCDETKPGIDVKEAQLTLETVPSVPGINVEATQIALSDVQDLSSINVQTSQIAAENIEDVPSVNIQVTPASAKCFEDISSMDSEDNTQDSTSSIASISSINVHMAQEKECLEINNSNNVVKDRSIDNEVEMIFDEMRLNYKLITPLPKTPITSCCQVEKTDNKDELVNMKNLLSNVGNYLMESLSMPVVKLRENVNQLWFSKLFSNGDSSNLIDDSLGDPFSSDNVDEPTSQSNLIIPEHDSLAWSPDPNISVISKEALKPEDIDQKISLHEDTPEMDNEDCTDQSVLHLGKDNVCFNDSEHVEITSPTTKRRRAKNTKKLTNLVKYRKKCELTKYKIRSATPLLMKRRFKPKRIELIKHMQQNNASAILNNKEAYAKAAQVMAELNARKSLTNPVNIENDTSAKDPNHSDIKCTQLPTEIFSVNAKKTDNAKNKSFATKESESLDATLQKLGVPLKVDQESAIVTRSMKSAQLFSVSSVPASTTQKGSITPSKVFVASPKDIVLSRTSPKLSVVSPNTAILLRTHAEAATVSLTPAVVKRSRFFASPKYVASSKAISSPSPRLSVVPTYTAIVVSPTPAESANVSSIPAVVTRSHSFSSPKFMPNYANTSPSLPESSVTSPKLTVISPTSTKPGASSDSRIKASKNSITSPELNVVRTKLPLTPKTMEDVAPKPSVVSPKPSKASHDLTVASPVPLITLPDSAFTKSITRLSLNNSVDMISSITTRSRIRGVHAEIQNTNENQENDEPPLMRKRTLSDNDDLINKRLLLSSGKIKKLTEIDIHPQQTILGYMIDKYASETLMNGTKRASDAILKTICDKIEKCTATITDVPLNKCTSALEQLIVEMKKYDRKVFLLGLMKFVTMTERKAELFGKRSHPPMPQMTQTEQVLLYLIEHLRYNWGIDLVDVVLRNIEHRLFKLNHTPEFDVIESTSHLYAVVCRRYDEMSRLLMFILDAMYCTSFKSVPLIRQCLEVAPSVIPLAHMKEAKTPLFTCLVYLLHFYKCEDRHNRVQDLKNILQRRFFYQFTEWNESKMLDVLRYSIKDLRNIPHEKKLLKMALLILGKRNGAQWTQNKLIWNVLQPIIDNTELAEYKRSFCLSMVGPLMRPFSNDMKVHCEFAMNNLTNILQTDPSKEMEEAALSSFLQMARHDFHRVNQMLYSRKMSGMSSELHDLIRYHIRTRTRKTWIRILFKM